jgi:hypothetical protein
MKERLFYLKKKQNKQMWLLGKGLVHSGLQCPGGDLVLLTAEGESHEKTRTPVETAAFHSGSQHQALAR